MTQEEILELEKVATWAGLPKNEMYANLFVRMENGFAKTFCKSGPDYRTLEGANEAAKKCRLGTKEYATGFRIHTYRNIEGAARLVPEKDNIRELQAAA